MDFKVGDLIQDSSNNQATILRIGRLGVSHALTIKWASLERTNPNNAAITDVYDFTLEVIFDEERCLSFTKVNL